MGALPQIFTRQSYSGPVQITVVARTDKHSIRLNAFNSGTAIFNWEVRPGELRVH
jgi:hypothetical protein